MAAAKRLLSISYGGENDCLNSTCQEKQMKANYSSSTAQRRNNRNVLLLESVEKPRETTRARLERDMIDVFFFGFLIKLLRYGQNVVRFYPGSISLTWDSSIGPEFLEKGFLHSFSVSCYLTSRSSSL